MKNKKRLIVSVISSLLLVSSIIVIAPIIKQYAFNKNIIKNSSLANTIKKSNTRNMSNVHYTGNSVTLINNLDYVERYISNTLIQKQGMLKLSIIGGWYSKAAKKRGDKKTKESELANFSKHLKHVHRYEDQTSATIDNSDNSLIQENKRISEIISIIKDHPYNYGYYLNSNGYIIPNLNFFINYNTSSGLNNINRKKSNISSTVYNINKINSTFNSISLMTEEAVVNAKGISSGGSSIYAASFKKVTFQAKIITYDSTTNSYKYATPTATKKLPMDIIHKSPKQELINSGRIENYNNIYPIVNHLYSFNTNRIDLSKVESSFDIIPAINILSPLPSYFNTHVGVVAKPGVKYNKIIQFDNNFSLYIPTIILLPILSVVTFIITYKKVGKVWKKYKTSPELKRQNEETLDTNQAFITNKYKEIDGADDINNIEELHLLSKRVLDSIAEQEREYMTTVNLNKSVRDQLSTNFEVLKTAVREKTRTSQERITNDNNGVEINELIISEIENIKLIKNVRNKENLDTLIERSRVRIRLINNRIENNGLKTPEIRNEFKQRSLSDLTQKLDENELAANLAIISSLEEEEIIAINELITNEITNIELIKNTRIKSVLDELIEESKLRIIIINNRLENNELLTQQMRDEFKQRSLTELSPKLDENEIIANQAIENMKTTSSVWRLYLPQNHLPDEEILLRAMNTFERKATEVESELNKLTYQDSKARIDWVIVYQLDKFRRYRNHMIHDPLFTKEHQEIVRKRIQSIEDFCAHFKEDARYISKEQSRDRINSDHRIYHEMDWSLRNIDSKLEGIFLLNNKEDIRNFTDNIQQLLEEWIAKLNSEIRNGNKVIIDYKNTLFVRANSTWQAAIAGYNTRFSQITTSAKEALQESHTPVASDSNNSEINDKIKTTAQGQEEIIALDDKLDVNAKVNQTREIEEFAKDLDII